MNRINKNSDINNKKFALVLLVISIVLITGTIFDYSNKLKSYSYNETIGKVTRFERRARYKNNNYIEFEYQYIVAGKIYRNNIVGYGIGNADAYEAVLKEKNDVIVFYNKNNPQESVLVKGVSFIYLLPILISLIILAYASIAYFSSKSELARKIWEIISG